MKTYAIYSKYIDESKWLLRKVVTVFTEAEAVIEHNKISAADREAYPFYIQFLQNKVIGHSYQSRQVI